MDDKILVTRASLPPFDEYINEIRSIWDNHWLTNMGEKHGKFQHMLKEYMGVDNVELMVNGHMALEMTLQALNLKGEVITSPFTFASTTHAIVRNGLTPVFCDINEDDYTIDVSKIEDLITPRTCAIVPIHVYGNICNIEEIECIAQKYDLRVIYDAAHTFGEKYKGMGIGKYGDASIFSFHATKVFNSIEGGCVCYSESEIGENLYNLKNFGIKNEESVIAVGANAKMNEFQAAMGICNLKHLDDNIISRKRIVNIYQNVLKDVPGINLWHEQKDVEHNYAYFPIIINQEEYGLSRDQLYDKLKKNGVYTRKYFYPLTNAFEAYKGLYSIETTPIAYCISKKVLTLPLYPDLSLDIVEKICNIIKKGTDE